MLCTIKSIKEEIKGFFFVLPLKKEGWRAFVLLFLNVYKYTQTLYHKIIDKQSTATATTTHTPLKKLSKA